MLNVLIVKNPFEKKYELKEEVVLSTNLRSYIDNSWDKDIFYNNKKINDIELDTIYPTDGDQLIIMPHVAGGDLGNLLGFVAMIALSAWAGAIIGGAGVFGYSLAAHSIGAYLAAGAVMYLGGRLINSLFPQQVATNNFSDYQRSQTYGWDLPTVATQEGGIIGETYGTCIPQPQLLEEHVETSTDSKQYLNLLYCGGYGEVDSITDIRIDSTPIENFSGVQIETRLGTNDQTPISFFTNTPVDQSVGLILDVNKPLIRTTDATKANALEITLEWNNGLYHLNDDGGYGNASVTIQIDYRKTKTADWTTAGTYTITNNSADAFRKAFKFADAIEDSQYDVKVTETAKDSGSRNMTLVEWSLLTSYSNSVYCRPNKVLLGLRILATNQLSGGVPNINWRQTRSKVYVYNPKNKVYEVKAANNPIWAAYDILHGCRYLKNLTTNKYEYVVSGCKHESLDVYYDQWVEAAAYADEVVADQNGQKEKRFQFDAFFDTSQKRYDAAVKAAAIGHSNIIIHGINYGIVTDKPGKISQVFSEGRTKVSSIKGTFTSKDERAKSIEITYNDENNDYKNTQFTLHSPNWNKDEDGQDNTAQLTLFGVSRRSQAYREGMMALATNERQLQFVELETDIDGLVAEYGDVVGYAHAVSRIGIASGRLSSVNNNIITLDKDVTMETGKNYEVYINLSDDTLIKREVVTQPGKTSTITVTTAFETDKIPQVFDCYTFGELNKAIKPYRIVGASRDGDLQVKLKLAEYDEAIYTADTNYDQYSDIDYTNYQGLDLKQWETDVAKAVEINDSTNVYKTDIDNGYNIVIQKQNYDNVILTFPTVNDLVKNGLLNLNFGMKVRTLGYYYPGDGGGAEYIIKNLYDFGNYPWALYLGKSSEYEYKVLTDTTSVPLLDKYGNYRYDKDSDGKLIVNKDENGNPKFRSMYAVICSEVVNYRMFGAKLDGQTDDGDKIAMCHKYQKSTYTIEPLSKRKYYPIKVKNNFGVIRKDNDIPVSCCGDIDLSGSKLLIQDCNATWFGFYLWGDNEEDYVTFEPLEDTQETYKKDNFIVKTDGNLSQLRQNAIITMKETPYAVRDDSGYLYSEPRYELLLHTCDGILANPITYDWDNAGGLEIKAPLSDYTTHEISTETANSQFEIFYNMIPTAHYNFKGCDVELTTSDNKYCSVLWCKCHNAHVSGFNFYPDSSKMHNTVFKNTMIYIWGSYNVEVSDITGFNSAGKIKDGANATSGYVIRATNCLDLRLHDISVQGYWGATAMNCVKDVHIERVNINRLDIHNYFYNLYIDHCNLYNHAIQIGEGRGICQITNSNFYINKLEADSYPNAHILEFNTTYGRIFEGKILIENCNAYLKAPDSNEFDICKIEFAPEAVSTLDSYKFPEVTIRDCNFYSYDNNTYLVYFMISGLRKCKTSTKAPTNVRDYSRDTGNDDKGTLNWKYLGRGVDWLDDGNEKNQNLYVGEIVRTYDSRKDAEGKTAFFNRNYFICTKAGKTLQKTEANKPTDLTGKEFTNGTATLKYVRYYDWQANKQYNTGDYCYTETNMWMPVFCWQSVSAGKSNGYRPTHTSGKMIEGLNVYPYNLDACYWQYIGLKEDCITKTFKPNITVNTNDILFADHKAYLVTSGGTLEDIPPQNTSWTGSFQFGSAMLAFVGKEWTPKTWWAKGAYCITINDDGNEAVYQLVDQNGTTSGNVPVRGNARTVDGDIIWEWVAQGDTGRAWQPLTSYNNDDVVVSYGNQYKCIFDGKVELPHQITLENISTNMTTGGDVFAFLANTDIPCKLNNKGKWTIKVDNVELYKMGKFDFGRAGINPPPTLIEYNGATYNPSTISGTGSGTIDTSNIYTKTEVNNLLANKSDVYHTHDSVYVKPADLAVQLATKLDIADTRVHSSYQLGSRMVDEAGMGQGMVLWYDVNTKKLKYSKVSDIKTTIDAGGDAGGGTSTPTTPTTLGNIIYTKAIVVDTTKVFDETTADSNYQFTTPTNVNKFRITAQIASTGVSAGTDSYIEFITKDGKNNGKIMLDSNVKNGAIVDCTAGQLYAFKLHITTSAATTITLNIDTGEKVEALETTNTNVYYYNYVYINTKQTIYSKSFTLTGSGTNYTFEDWTGGKDFQFTIPKACTRFKITATSSVTSATISSGSYLSFNNSDWSKSVKVSNLVTGAVVACTAEKLYDFCMWIGTNASCSVTITVEAGGNIEDAIITDSTVPSYN